MTEQEPATNPFPGLRPFEFHENHLFFGREGQSEELLKKLRHSRFLAVVGTSGSGKSSLVRAGLLPLLYGGFMTKAGSSWRISLFRPGNNPIRNLAIALNSPNDFILATQSNNGHPHAAAGAAALLKSGEPPRADIKTAVIETMLRRSALGLVEHIKRAKLDERENLLIVVDQFEELFRFKQDFQHTNAGDEAAAFVKLLLEAAGQDAARIYVVMTMRSDFLGDCAQFRDLPEAINNGQYLIPRMTRDQQRKAVTSPAAVYGAEMTPRLIHRLLNDVGDNPDQLPILQHALMRTWETWTKKAGRSHPIDLEEYEKIGGMADALSNHADEAYEELTAVGKEIAEKLFKALTETLQDNRQIRRPVKLKVICDITGHKQEDVIAVIETFRREHRSFLMPPPGVPLAEDSLIDISHESLIRGWKKLGTWVKEEAHSARVYRRIADAAHLYHKGEGNLLRALDLSRALQWQADNKPNDAWARRYADRFDEATEFLKQSADAYKAEVARKEREQQERLERERALALEKEQRLEAERLRAEAENRTAQLEKRKAEAEKLQAEAEKRQADAEKRQAEAERNRAEADRLRAEAENRTAQLEKRKAEAERSQAVAERNQAEAERKSEREARLRAEAEQKRERAEREARNARRLRYLAVALAAITLLALTSTVYAFSQQALARRNREEAIKQRQIAEEERKLSEVARVNAESARLNAEAAEKKAQAAAAIAMEEREKAEQAKALAVAEKARTEVARRQAEEAQREALKQREIAQQQTVRAEQERKLSQERIRKLEEALKNCKPGSATDKP